MYHLWTRLVFSHKSYPWQEWKTSSVDDDFSGRQNQQNLLCNICRSTLMASDTSILAQPQQASQLEPELGTAQPQLVSSNAKCDLMKMTRYLSHCLTVLLQTILVFFLIWITVFEFHGQFFNWEFDRCMCVFITKHYVIS